MQVDIVGQKFNKLMVLRYHSRTKHGESKWVCLCDCGKESITTTAKLRSGHAKSCGCIRSEATKKSRTTHGHFVGNKKSPEFNCWWKIKERCFNENTKAYHRYGGRGITMCERWQENFLNFFEDMGTRPSPTHSIERNENDKGYFPENCRWATPKEQSRNKRNNIHLEYDGRSMIISDWAKELGVTTSSIKWMLKNGKDFSYIYWYYTTDEVLPLKRTRK